MVQLVVCYGAPVRYHVPELSFGSLEHLQAAMGSAEGQAAGADVPTFASGGATLMIVEM